MPTSAKLRIHPAGLLKLLLGIGFVLALVNIIVQVVLYQAADFRGLNSLVRFTNVDGENSVPSWYSSTQLFVCAGVLFTIAGLECRTKRPYARSWSGLAVVFLLLSIDETIQVHELVSDVLEETFNLSGFFYFAWVVQAALFVFVVPAR